ncbi:MAG TPA: hypothetical protein VK834_03825, partial [Bradyrhizobium sp.]|nr:hypothetical protein [Bradyrhizobium sp.]
RVYFREPGHTNQFGDPVLFNDNKVPQLFIFSGASLFADPNHFPWTMVNNVSYQTEAHIFAQHILATKPEAKIGLLYQNDGYGKDYLTGVRDTLGCQIASNRDPLSRPILTPLARDGILLGQGNATTRMRMRGRCRSGVRA